MQGKEDKTSTKSISITINDENYINKNNKLNKLLSDKTAIESKLKTTESQKRLSLRESVSAKKGVGPIIPGYFITHHQSSLEEGRHKYDLHRVDTSYDEWIPERYSSYEPDLETRKWHLERIEQLKSQLEELKSSLNEIHKQIAKLQTEIHDLLRPERECIIGLEKADRDFTLIEINTLETISFLFRLIKNKPGLVNIINIDLSNNHFDDNDAIVIAKELQSLGRIPIHININLRNNKIENPGGIALRGVLESTNRPTRLGINLAANNISFTLLNEENCSLFSAVKANDIETVKLLLNQASEDKEWSINRYGNSALHYALSIGNEEMVALLLKHKFPLDQENNKKITPTQLLAAMAYDFKNPKQQKFAQIYMQCLTRYYDETNDLDLKKEIDRFHNYLASAAKKEFPELYFEIANYYFCRPNKTAEDYTNAILFFTLSGSDSGAKNICYLNLMGIENPGIGLEKINIVQLQNDLGLEEFARRIKTSGVIEKLEASKGSPAVDLELQKLYSLVEGSQSFKKESRIGNKEATDQRFFSPAMSNKKQEPEYPWWLITIFCIPVLGQLGFLLYKALDYCFPVEENCLTLI